MASEDDDNHHLYNDDDLDDDDDVTTPLSPPSHDPDDVIPDASSSSSDDEPDVTDDVIASSSAAVTVAIPPVTTAAAPPTSAVTVALPDPKRHQKPVPIDDSRRLFQRLWTDEDEIELLQGFLDYTSGRGTTSSGHHHDTAAFYDQIKSKLQLEFNKNQLVEKLRRLKKKYRNVLSKISSGKDFAFKSPHDQQTFEISRKIWSNLSTNLRPGGGGGGGGGSAGGGGAGMGMGMGIEFDDDDQNHNHNPNPNLSANSSLIMATPPPPSSGGGGYMISHINLNNTVAPCGDVKPMMFDSMGGGGSSLSGGSPSPALGGGVTKLSSRKRPRSGGRMDDKFVRVNLGGGSGAGGGGSGGSGYEGVNLNVNASGSGNANANSNYNNASNNNNNMNNSNNNNNNVGVGPAMHGLIEETVRNCLSPVFKDLINNAVSGLGLGGGVGGGGGIKGVAALALNAVPMNFSGLNTGFGGDMMDERWRKQQILELEVYSRRLELVQDQIKSTLEELRSMES